MFYVKLTRLAAVATASATLLFAGAIMAEARAENGGKHKTHTAQGANGSWSRSTTGQRTANGHTRSTTATRNDGKTAMRDTTVVNDRAAGTRSVDATTTGFNGRATTYSSDAQRTETGHIKDVTRTLPNGQVNSRTVDFACDKDARSCMKSVTGRNGG
jgi:hypothetical protein